MLRGLRGLALAAGLAVAPAAAAPAPALPPFACAGPFAAGASHAALARRFGARNLVFKTVPAPEGEMEKATLLFPRDEARSVRIVWFEEKRRRRPAQISVWSKAWRTPEGIVIGMGLKEVEALNGRPFTLYGFGWDYAGTVIDWQGGKLEGKGCRLLLRFAPGPEPYPAGLDGEAAFSSDDERMRAAAPLVYEMMLMFE